MDGTNTTPGCSTTNDSHHHLLPGVTWISSYAPSSSTTHSLSTQTLTYIYWNAHAWTCFSPNVPNISTLLNHTVPFGLTLHTNPPTLTPAAPHPHAMSLMINLRNKVKVKAYPLPPMWSLWPQSKHLFLYSLQPSRMPYSL